MFWVGRVKLRCHHYLDRYIGHCLEVHGHRLQCFRNGTRKRQEYPNGMVRAAANINRNFWVLFKDLCRDRNGRRRTLPHLWHASSLRLSALPHYPRFNPVIPSSGNPWYVTLRPGGLYIPSKIEPLVVESWMPPKPMLELAARCHWKKDKQRMRHSGQHPTALAISISHAPPPLQFDIYFPYLPEAEGRGCRLALASGKLRANLRRPPTALDSPRARACNPQSRRGPEHHCPGKRRHDPRIFDVRRRQRRCDGMKGGNCLAGVFMPSRDKHLPCKAGMDDGHYLAPRRDCLGAKGAPLWMPPRPSCGAWGASVLTQLPKGNLRKALKVPQRARVLQRCWWPKEVPACDGGVGTKPDTASGEPLIAVPGPSSVALLSLAR
ncbi:hypothetical protein GGTG_07511 [Gaeumannomyces tritici R3-111a-1]|uniref:Uncharacterized protein n=1 Tax=Gaeumannomyces tritici (strain R3-111a-1) TaxID=644352 RepID=J3P1W3_GAET3|nr:hypothetical protein GGTG_07511 [Gaeumannomyces tritici R3-111a-1]EJT73655.1 hypothetical protein GGTG_07511 [Gaeumannomyces tritici R3-111a-1]